MHTHTTPHRNIPKANMGCGPQLPTSRPRKTPLRQLPAAPTDAAHKLPQSMC
jgi:hypothetical protein